MSQYEWNEAKRVTTLEKHGIDFRDATEVFETVHLELEARSDVELRRIAVGEVDGVTIAVVFTRREDAIRIITARKARRDEREQYQALLARRGSEDDV
ncbi:BrnT family toxin [Rhodosalinus halophilus]|uniref:BrnT family toxin n=1 Tax=Rhodosalinus halophilus TaxID=2259333 RepID=A0A365U7U3_9RHOB|nr:BrnT family toxin [Rhodosalinus halophilus]RBI84702.1 BrnT family toxin [Rhodosalinus halophilus]